MVPPPPKQVVLCICPDCGRVTVGTHVNREDEIPARFCRFDGRILRVAAYTFDRQLGSWPEPDPHAIAQSALDSTGG